MERRRQQVSPRCWTGRTESAPAPSAVRWTSAAAAASTPPTSRAGDGKPWASTACRPRSRRRQLKPGRGRAQLRPGRRDAAAVGKPGDVRLLPRHRLLPGPRHRTASLPRKRYLCPCQPRGHGPADELRPEPVAVAGRRRIAAGGRDRLHWLGDARSRTRAYRGPGLADEQDHATVVQAAPTDLNQTLVFRAVRPTADEPAVPVLMPN